MFVPGLRNAILAGEQQFRAFVVTEDGTVTETALTMDPLTADERQIIADGCLINYYRSH